MSFRESPSIRLILAADRLLTRRLRVVRFALRVLGAIGGYFAVAFLARFGIDWIRFGLLGLSFALLGVAIWFSKRKRSEVATLRDSLARTYGVVDPENAGRAERGLALLHRLNDPLHEREGSKELAEFHLFGLLDRVPAEKIVEYAGRRAKRLRRSGFLVCAGLVGLFFAYELPLAEGTLALFARGGKAPLSIGYSVEAIAIATVPEYTREKPSERLLFREEEILPGGSEVRVSFVPRVERNFVLACANVEVPLESDGRGTLVARFTLRESCRLEIFARLGDVLVRDTFGVSLFAKPDRPPKVELDGAPRTLELAKMEGAEVLRYRASDDYGLSEIVLVFRSGQREEKKRLVELGGVEKVFEGAYSLPPNHAFLRKSFLPISIAVEAKDDSRFTGPNVGRSEALVLLPPKIGQLEAEAMRPLYEFRGKVSEALGGSLERDRLDEGRLRSELESAMTELAAKLSTASVPLTSETHFLELSLARTLRNLSNETTVDFLLATDVLVQSHARSQAQKVGKSLGALVRELASSLERLRDTNDPAEKRLASELTKAAKESSDLLAELGVLGRDLGGVARGDLGRVERLVERSDLLGAIRAALHLAARLERATPSFGSKSSGRGKSGGVESGGGSSGGEGEASDAPGEFEQSAQAREKLAQDHAKQLSDLERLLAEARQAAASEPAMSKRLDELADSIEAGTDSLPHAGPDGSASSEAGRAKQSARAMADALREGDLGAAASHGKDAKRALEALQKRIAEGAYDVSEREAGRAREAIERAQQELGKLAQDMKSELGKALQGKRGELSEKERELAERAESLLERSRDSLDEREKEALSRAAAAMKKAARELGEGSEDASLRAAEEAQAALERAQVEGRRSGQESDSGNSGGREGELETSGDVPESAEDKAKEFRLRAAKGLSRAAGGLGPAVAKYAGELQ